MELGGYPVLRDGLLKVGTAPWPLEFVEESSRYCRAFHRSPTSDAVSVGVLHLPVYALGGLEQHRILSAMFAGSMVSSSSVST